MPWREGPESECFREALLGENRSFWKIVKAVRHQSEEHFTKLDSFYFSRVGEKYVLISIGSIKESMMKKLMLWIWMGMITLSVLLPSSVFAVLGEVYDNYDAEFDYSLCCGNSGDIASVHSWVEYNDPVDAYRYYYQIHDVSSDYKINYFQFAIFETELGFNYGKDQPGIDPIIGLASP